MNVINDKWLFVTYLDGHNEQISVRQAFTDADKIKCLYTPTFHGKKAYIYDVPVMQFLSVILLSAYFKPENDFEAGGKYFSQKLMKKGWNLKTILKYLDKWEHKFNLYDEQFPFMQDITLKETAEKTEEKDKKHTYILNINPLAPGSANKIFESGTAGSEEELIESYKMDDAETVYALLFMNHLGITIAPGPYPINSLLNRMRLFVLLQGKNLKETIIYNSLPLRDSSKPDEYNPNTMYDKPVWEFDSIFDIPDAYGEFLGKNHLICSFFPSFPVYILRRDGETVCGVFAGKTHRQVIDKDARKALENVYFEIYPYGIKKLDKKGVCQKWNYKNDIKVSELLTEITKKTDRRLCNVLSDTYQYNHDADCFIYYRNVEFHTTDLFYSCGRFDEISQDLFDFFEDEAHNKMAEIFQWTLTNYNANLSYFINEAKITSRKAEISSKFSQSVENYFFNTFTKECADVEPKEVFTHFNDFMYKTANDLINGCVNTSIIQSPVDFVNAKRKFAGLSKKTKEKCYSLWEEFANG